MNRSYMLWPIPLLLLSSVAYSQSRNMSYSCVVEWVVGGWYDSSTKHWEGRSFKPATFRYSKFILGMKFLQTRPVQTFHRMEDLDDYAVFITPAESPLPRDCQGDNDTGIVTMRLNAMRCSAGVLDYSFDLKTNRFLQVHASGYVNGDDDNDNIPFIAGGACTKLGE
jgi:hypothetical protein